MIVAGLYDVHGNAPALEAVLAELDELKPDSVVFGGDLAAGAPPRGTIAHARNAPHARGGPGQAPPRGPPRPRGADPRGAPPPPHAPERAFPPPLRPPLP